MQVKISVNDTDTIAQLHGLSVDAYVSAWAEAVMELARRNAREKLGGGKFGEEIARTVRQDTRGNVGEVYSVGKIGEHVHQGGPIQSPNGKMLAIPTKWNTHRDLWASTWPVELFAIGSKARNRAYLFEKPAKGEKLGRPMFFLTPKTKPQKPRPWWPDKAAVETETVKFFDENF